MVKKLNRRSVTFYPDLIICISSASSTGTLNPCAVSSTRMLSYPDDVKANVLVDHDHRARLADFGLTKVLYNTTTAATTLAGGGLGTVRWMAPELCEMDDGHGSNQATVRSDIYALTITIWEVRRAACACAPCRSTLTLPRQLFTLEKPFLSITRDIAVPRYVCAGHRPYKPRGCERIGFSEELWIVMQSGWSSYPSARPPLSAFSAVLARSS
jgi:serine/threonine protein kinase